MILTIVNINNDNSTIINGNAENVCIKLKQTMAVPMNIAIIVKYNMEYNLIVVVDKAKIVASNTKYNRANNIPNNNDVWIRYIGRNTFNIRMCSSKSLWFLNEKYMIGITDKNIVIRDTNPTKYKHLFSELLNKMYL